ncbi:MAG: hypothetical protein H7145_08330 [Akkermansiaceae bacterium]|nr:hypothetical protein [Armatimonadota bacterium]
MIDWKNSHLHQFEPPDPGETMPNTGRSRRTSLRHVPTTDPFGEPFDLQMEDSDEKARDEAQS